MDYFESGTICTKNKLWKKKRLVIEIIDILISKGYEFVEMVYGEPNDFTFADQYEELEQRLSMKGFFGVRIKMRKQNVVLSVESNTNGIDNVKYSIFAETEEQLKKAVLDSLALKEIMKPSNNTLAKVEEKFAKSRRMRITFVTIGVIVLVLLVNRFIPIISIATSIFMFAPFWIIYLIYVYSRRR